MSHICIFCHETFEEGQDLELTAHMTQHKEDEPVDIECFVCKDKVNIIDGFIEIGPGTTIYTSHGYMLFDDCREEIEKEFGELTKDEAGGLFMPCIHPSCFGMFFHGMATDIKINATSGDDDGQEFCE